MEAEMLTCPPWGVKLRFRGRFSFHLYGPGNVLEEKDQLESICMMVLRRRAMYHHFTFLVQ